MLPSFINTGLVLACGLRRGPPDRGANRDFEKLLNYSGGALDPPPVEPAPHSKKTSEASMYDNVGRNDPCPCGSGRKYEKCCQRKRL